MEKNTPDFVISYDTKIKSRCGYLNNIIASGITLRWYVDTYNTKKELAVITEIIYAKEDGMTECYIITDTGKKYNVGSMILNKDLIYV